MKAVLVDSGIVLVDQGATHSSLKLKRRFELVVDNKNFSRVFVKELLDSLALARRVTPYYRSSEFRQELVENYSNALLHPSTNSSR